MLTHAIILPTLKIETWSGGAMVGRERQQIDTGREIKRESREDREKKSDMK